ncbi:MAG: transcriptional regulator [Burkholderiales bacterium PBB3]|nr:MAG: transcriptional regulator [Burkholderiales bacterium PBB3]
MNEHVDSVFPDDDDTPRPSSWSQDRRLKFIDFRLRWEGRINRSDLVDFFDISMPQASTDVSKYSEAAPQNLSYDARIKSYVRTPNFKPLFARSGTRTYLNELQALETKIMEPKSSFVGWKPDLGIVPLPNRNVEGKVLSTLLQAVREGRKVFTLYQGMVRPEPVERTISPHAFAFDGMRWHVRAYCHLREDFRDFVIARLTIMQVGDATNISKDDDTQWHTMLQLVISAHPSLPQQARKAIQLDYGMHEGTTKFECRHALLFYALRRLRLETPEDAASGAQQQIVLLNRAELQPFIDQLQTKKTA